MKELFLEGIEGLTYNEAFPQTVQSIEQIWPIPGTAEKIEQPFS